MGIPVAVVGYGYWGRNLVCVVDEIGALAAVCDADAERAPEFAESIQCRRAQIGSASS